VAASVLRPGELPMAAEGLVSFGQEVGVGGGPAAGMLENVVEKMLIPTGYLASAL
jgi:hypothetical protein